MSIKDWSKENLLSVLEISHTKSEVLRNMGLEPNGGNSRTLNTKLRFFGLEVKDKISKALDSCDIESMVAEATSYRCMLLKLNLDESATNYRKIKNFFVDNPQYDISHFTGMGWSRGMTSKTNKRIMESSKRQEAKHEELFCENSKHNAKVARTHVLKYDLKEYKCSECGIKEWNGAELTLHLDHINGINNDHRLGNLRFLCPNCHQQTSTWGNKK